MASAGTSRVTTAPAPAHGPFADGEAGQNGRVSPNRGALPDSGAGQFVPVFLAARKGIVREGCVWPDENIVLHLDPIPELNTAFHRYAVADRDVIFDKSVVANVTFRANVGAGQDVGKGPDTGIVADRG